MIIEKDSTVRKPKIIFTKEAGDKMWQYVFAVKTEISGYGKVRQNDDGDFVVEDVAIYEQVVTGTETHISGASVAKFAHELHLRNESTEMWKLWWHSHNTMGVFWSETDRIAMSKGNNYGRDYLLSVVVNFKREVLGCVDLYEPFRHTLDNTPVEFTDSFSVPKKIMDEVKKKVKPRTGVQPAVGFSQKELFGASQQKVQEGGKNPRGNSTQSGIIRTASGWYDTTGIYHSNSRPVVYGDDLEGYGFERDTDADGDEDTTDDSQKDNTEGQGEKYNELGIGHLDLKEHEKDLLYNYFAEDGKPLSNRQKKRAKKLIKRLGL